MRAANAASKSLGSVVQAGWTAEDPTATGAFSMAGILSIVASFRLAVSLLRELMPGAIDVELVTSSFVGKLVAVRLVSLFCSYRIPGTCA